MVSPKFQKTILYVRALPGKDVREISSDGKPLMALRVVGKENGEIISAGVRVPYHAHYIAKLKEGSLAPMDLATADLAGVPYPIITNLKNNSGDK